MNIEELYAEHSTKELSDAKAKIIDSVERSFATLTPLQLLRVRGLLGREDYATLCVDEYNALRACLTLTSQLFTRELIEKELFRREWSTDEEDGEGGRPVLVGGPPPDYEPGRYVDG